MNKATYCRALQISINLSLLSQLGFCELNFKKCFLKHKPRGAVPNGMPGCPLFASSNASIQRPRMQFMDSLQAEHNVTFAIKF